MDLTTLALSVYNFVKPVFTSKVAGQIAGDFKEATKGSMLELWGKIKPWFIIEEKEGEKETKELERVKKAPDDSDYQEAFINELKIQLKENPEMAKEIEAILTKMEKGDDEQAKTIIRDAGAVVFGSMKQKGKYNAGRDMNFGKKHK